MEKQIETLFDETTQKNISYEILEGVSLNSSDVWIQLFKARNIETNEISYMFAFSNSETGTKCSLAFKTESWLKVFASISTFASLIDKDFDIKNNPEALQTYLEMMNIRQ